MTTNTRQRPLIIAHRGASAVASENTMAAFKRAMVLGADGIELDVRLTRDGVPVVIHDASLRRTGLREGAIARMTSTELADVDVGTWFTRAHPALQKNDFSDERIPTLDNVLDLFANAGPYKDLLIYVEIKADREKALRPDLISSVADLIIRRKMVKRVVVVSFELSVIESIKRFDASIRAGALFSPKQTVALKTSRNIIAAAIDAGADEILLHKLIARPRLVDRAHQQSLPVLVWTVDDPSWIRRHQNLDLHALITNNPALFTGPRQTTVANEG